MSTFGSFASFVTYFLFVRPVHIHGPAEGISSLSCGLDISSKNILCAWMIEYIKIFSCWGLLNPGCLTARGANCTKKNTCCYSPTRGGGCACCALGAWRLGLARAVRGRQAQRWGRDRGRALVPKYFHWYGQPSRSLFQFIYSYFFVTTIGYYIWHAYSHPKIQPNRSTK